MVNEKELRALAQKWRDLAMKQVPAAYAERGLHSKYFRLDNEAAGLDSCADELLELLDAQRSPTPRAADHSEQKCPSCGKGKLESVTQCDYCFVVFDKTDISKRSAGG